MAANKKFTPRASTNLIEEEATDAKIEETTEETVTPVKEEESTPDVSTPIVEEEEPEQLKMTLDDEPKTETPKESPKEETIEEKKSEEESVTFTAKTESKPIERMVKVRFAKKYDGCIGGTRYHFEKDDVANVSENVKRILNSAEGMLKPL